MLEEKGNLWKKHADGNCIIIPTNGCVNSSGHAIMGRGLAKECKDKYVMIPQLYGEHLKSYIKHNLLAPPYILLEYKIILFQTKTDWKQDSKLDVIELSADTLCKQVKSLRTQSIISSSIYLPHLGCGEGNLKWDDVRDVLKILDDTFIALEME